MAQVREQAGDGEGALAGGVTCGMVAGGTVCPDTEAGCGEGIFFGVEQGGDDAGECIAHAAGGHARVAGAVDGEPAVGGSNDGGGEFEDDDGAGVFGELLGVVDGGLEEFFDGDVEELCHFAGMWGEDHIGAGGKFAQAFVVVAVRENVDGVGVDDEVLDVFAFEYDLEGGAGAVVGFHAGADGDGVDAFQKSEQAAFAGAVEGFGEHGGGHDFGEGGGDGGHECVEGADGDESCAGGQGAVCGHEDGAGFFAAAAQEQKAAGIAFVEMTGAGCDVAAGPGFGEEVGGKSDVFGDCVWNADVGGVEFADVLAGRQDGEAEFGEGEGDGCVGVDAGSVNLAGECVDAARDVDGKDRSGLCVEKVDGGGKSVIERAI